MAPVDHDQCAAAAGGHAGLVVVVEGLPQELAFDPEVAWVQTPQWFYDLDEGTRLPTFLGGTLRLGRAGEAIGRAVEAAVGPVRLGRDPFGNDPEMRLNRIDAAFTTLLNALGNVAPASNFDLDDDWCAPVGAFQDTVSDGANRIISLCNRRAREYSSSR